MDSMEMEWKINLARGRKMREESRKKVDPLIQGLRDADGALARGDMELGTLLAVECGDALGRMAIDRTLAGMSESQCEAAGGVERMMMRQAKWGVAWCAGGNQTLTGDAEIETPNGKVRLDEFQGGEVWSWLNGKPVRALATKGFFKGYEHCWEVVFRDGQKLTMTAGHQFMSPNGEVRRLDQVKRLRTSNPGSRKKSRFDNVYATIALRRALDDLLNHMPDISIKWSVAEGAPNAYGQHVFKDGAIKKASYVGIMPVWDIHVLGTNCYFSGGVLHHNSGKSYIAATMFSRHLVERARGGEIYWVISPSAEKSVGTVQRYLWEMLPKGWLGTDNVWTEKNGFGSVNPILSVQIPGQDKKVVVKFKNQSQYDNDPTSFESETLSGVWVDEAVKEKCWQAIQPRLVVKGGWVLYSSIPSEGWMWQTFEEAEDKSKILVVKLWAGDNPAITPEALERLKASITDPDEYAMRIEGKFKIMSGIVFREFDVETHIKKQAEMPPKEELTFYGGLDVGWDHPTAFVAVGVDKQGVCWVYDEYGARLRTVEENAKAIKSIMKLKGITLAESVRIDPSCASITSANRVSVLSQFTKAGLPCTKARRTQDVGEKIIVNNIRQMFADGNLFVSERCTNLIRELKVWQYKRKNDGGQLSGEEFVDKDNDWIDALKYVLGSTLRYVDPKKPKVKAIYT